MSDGVSKCYAKYRAEKAVGNDGGVVAVILNIVIRKHLFENLKIEQGPQRDEKVSHLII